MSRTAKVTVSLPSTLLERLERFRKRRGETRSAAVTHAVEQWLKTEGGTSAPDRRYVEAYLRQPERLAEIEALAAAAISTWEPWS
jgi:metal-responsive CopG/Arc/MetJ family transcriptional regulator